MRLLALVATILVFAAAPALAQSEEEAQTKLLERWDGFEIKLRKIERQLAELQSAYNGAVGDEREGIRNQFKALRSAAVRESKELVSDIDSFVKTYPKNRTIRQRRLEDRVFTRLPAKVKAGDAEALYQLTKDGRYLHEAARLWRQAYNYEKSAELWGQACQRAATFEALKSWGEALIDSARFAEAKAAFARATEAATSDRERRETRTLAQNIDAYLAKWEIEKKLRAQSAEKNDLPQVRITTDRGVMIAELFEDAAPNTVANFIELTEKGFYNGLMFHRCQAQFMVQGGDPSGNGSGGPGYTIKDEFMLPGSRLHYRGSLSMANQNRADSGGSQFFVCNATPYWLNGKHTVFGRVIQGLEAAEVPALDPTNKAAPFRIQKIEVIRKRDHDYVATKIRK
jgi:cyclophilin family peptidyl-prolyl cis-trans isomerase